MIKLPSGREVSDDLLTDVADSIVHEFAGYGFTDFEVAVNDQVNYLSENGWRDSDEPYGEEDAKAIVGAVEAVAKEFAIALGKEYMELYEKFLANKDWGF